MVRLKTAVLRVNDFLSGYKTYLAIAATAGYTIYRDRHHLDGQTAIQMTLDGGAALFRMMAYKPGPLADPPKNLE